MGQATLFQLDPRDLGCTTVFNILPSRLQWKRKRTKNTVEDFYEPGQAMTHFHPHSLGQNSVTTPYKLPRKTKRK